MTGIRKALWAFAACNRLWMGFVCRWVPAAVAGWHLPEGVGPGEVPKGRLFSPSHGTDVKE
ncbi:hypothetical protein CJA_0209 [Cellvibrio japonicus Ueda107]|uniref:Uncharacterized protein n=1 Tax=Cellvibrio japonicus (strain Ueda107) TaxID=498211 RepID=B3PGF4_CELJU|nr:hypothetical protein CJA_0209 [Cellvibrio japonicus Ueda107]